MSAFGGLGSFTRRAKEPGPGSVDRRPRRDGVPVDRLPAILPEVKRGRRRRITVIGEEVLHTPTRLVEEFGTTELRELVNDMFATNAVASGAGLAATQIGVDLRVFVYDCHDAYDVRHVGHIVNPVVESLPDDVAGRQTGWEGCLSVPGGGYELSRANYAVVRGVDQRGNPLRIEGTGLLARCLLHETDHLDGMLYVDRLSEKGRKVALAEMEEHKQEIWDEWDERARELGK
ncbi:peptide deformylase [Mobilicoccus caccae]|uniref:Peptide deformylase n=1 Tax=Mobilicoccus caccae TaxID=1859295 RepID=A0ABQ6ITF5_9MICO|nr:peptide deformylase [Mobilicoccus caccae]GMA41229.1 peptide deformylase 3 [Mobilicoccus caccae]